MLILEIILARLKMKTKYVNKIAKTFCAKEFILEYFLSLNTKL